MTKSAYDDRAFDAMPGRALAARWVLTATLRLETAAHFGGQDDSALDMPILRCARTGRPLLPGTSLGGALRAYLLDRLAGFQSDEFVKNDGGRNLSDEAKTVAKLFGGVRGQDISNPDDAGQSPLIVFDALGTLPPDSASTEVRDGVLIESATGIAADHKKFDFEVLPPGTAFNVRFDVLVSADDDETELLSLLCASLEGLDNGDIRIGMRRSRGLGEVACSHWKARRFDLASSQGWLEWIDSDHKRPICSTAQTFGCPSRAIEDAVGNQLVVDVTDRRHRIVIEVEAAIPGDLLIRSPNAQADGPDVMHLSSGGRPILSGTSVTGVMRAHALRIVRLIHGLSKSDAETFVAPLFGPREERTKNPGFKPEGSRLRVSEQPVTNGQSQRVSRVAIDRFTQGVVPTALFDEQPHAGGTVRLRFELRNPRDGEVGLLLLVLKDLLTGQLPVGGTSSVGRGVLIGRRMTIAGTGIDEPIQVNFDAAEARRGHVPSNSELNDLVQEFMQLESSVTEPEGATP